MAQDILITPGIVEPQILFRGSGASTTAIELNVLAGYQSASGNGTALVFEGTEGQLFSITDNLSSGTIFNVGDITGLSLFSVDANGTVKVGEFGTGVIVYPGLTLEDYVPSTTTNVLYNNAGVLTWAGNLTASSFIKSGGTSSQFLKADGSVDSSTYLTGNQTITLTGDASGSGTTSIAVTVLNDSHTHDSRYYTETEIANYFSGTAAITGYNKTNWDTAYGWGNHASAGYLTGNQTITLTGDASGSGTTSISVTVANDSHTHDTRYYTETEIANFFSGSTAITGYSKSNWDTAYGWGNHASAGYLTGNQTITLSGDASGSGTTSISVVVADDSHNHIISNVDGLQSALDAKLATSLKGAANGLAELDANGTVPASQLPSYVDDVLEYAATANFPATGETGKIYVAQDTNKTYRWSGSSYVEISASLALGTTSSTAHRGDHGSTAYTHSQTTTGSVHGSSTVGGNFLRLSNPSAVTFIRVNADNTVSTLDAATFRTAIGAGTSSTTGTVTSVASGNGMNFTTITGSGTVAMGTPSSVTLSSANSASGNTHTHAFAPGGTTAQYIRGDGTLATLPTYTVNNGTLTMGVSGTGLTGSASFTANQSGNSTFTVTSNATSANTASAIVARDGSGNFSASTVNTTQLNADNLRLDGNTLSSTNTNGNVIITPNGLGGVAAGTSSTVSGHHAVVGGGCANTSSCCFTTVGGGYTNTASNYGSTVSGGYFNNASGSHSFVGGGFTNTASGCYATASGGYISCATGNYSTVSGGCRNTASGNYSAILGGKSNDTNSCCNTFILGSNITASQVDTTFTQKLFVSHTTGATETLFNVEGSNGSLFSVSDSLSGSLMSVNNNAGLPIFEVFDDDSIVGGRFAQDDFVLTTGGDLGLGTASPSTKLQVVGDVTASSFIKSGGTSSQFLKADGSVDSSTYLTGNQTITLSGDASGSGTTSISVTVANDSHTHDTRYYTETEIGQFFAGTTAITGYNKSNWDTAYGWGNHASAGYLTGNQTITLSGDVSGSGTTSISVTVADDSHNHIISNVDGLQTALDGKAATNQNMYIGTTQVAINRSSGALSLAGVSIDGNAGTVTNGVYTTGSYADPSWITSINYSKLTGTVPTWNQNTTGSSYSVTRTVSAGSAANLIYTQMAGNDFFRLLVGGSTDGGYVELATADNSNEPIYVRQYAGSFATLTRTLTLLDASGNTYAPGNITANSLIKSGGTSSQFLKADGSVDSNSYITGNQTITLTGDASGSGTTSIAVTVANDSHTHDTRYYTETEIANFFSGTTAITGYSKSNWDTAYGWGNHASAGYLTGNQTITLSGDVSGSGTTSISVTVADDSHNHIISNVDGLQTALDAKANLSGATFTGDVYVGTGTADTQLHLRKADNNVSDHLIFYNGTTRVGEIGVHDNDWLRINQVTAKNIYTPRYIRADEGFWVDGTTKGINGAGNFVGGTIGGASDANVTNWDTAYGWGNHASAGYTTCTGTVTSVAAGNGLNFTTITGSGSVTLGTPGSTTLSSTNAVTTTSHTHAFAPGGTTAQYIRGDGTLATLPTYTVNNGTLTMAVSGTGLTGSASFTANQSGNSTFTVTSNATSSNTASAIVARDASGNFSAGAITATQVNVDNLRIDGSTLSSTNTNGAIVINPNGVGSTQADAGGNARGSYAVDFQRVRNTNAEAATGFNSSILGGRYNTASGCLSTVSGGSSNSATCSNSTVGGGCCNTASGNVYGFTTVSGGYCNTASGYYATVAGGGGSLGGNTASGNGSTISGGGGFLGGSTASGNYSVIAGGKSNCAGGNYSTVSGGTGNTVSGNYSTIVGGQSNNDCGFANTFILGSSINATQANTTYTQKLLVSETADAGATIFNVEGSGGSLFSVVDDLSGALMSVNTVAGLPALEVNSDYSLTAGRFNQNDFEITSGGNVGIGTASPGTKLEVVGSATATSFIKSGGTSSQFLKADGSVDSTSYTTCAGTVTSVAAGNGLNFTTITGSGSVTLGTPGSTTLSSTNAVTATSHTHAFAPGGTTAQYIRGDGTLATLPTYTVNNGTLTMAVSGTGLSGSATFTANQSGNSTFTVTSNATSANTVSTIVARDASGNFSAGTVNTTQLNADNLRLDGNTLSSTNTNGNVIITPNGTGGIAAGTNATVTGSYSTISGGYGNTASGTYSTVGGGLTNTASSYYSTVGGGIENCASGFISTVGGGYGNTALLDYSTVGGGASNCASNYYSTVSGGNSNCASGTNSSVSGGYSNVTNARHSTINGGHRNVIQSPTNECSSRGATISGGVGHNSSGGTLNATTGELTGTITCCNAGAFSTISGGLRNCATGTSSTIGGGYCNTASGTYSTVGGGRGSCTSGYASTVSGGRCHSASGNYSTVSGGGSNCASGSSSTVGGGRSNTASGYGSTIGGGGVVLFGSGHNASGSFSTIGGGGGLFGGANTASGNYSTVSGGYCNYASGYRSTIGGGGGNCALGNNSTVTGGYCNITNARHSTINGGYCNIIQSPTNECCARGVTIGGGVGHNTIGGTLDFTTGDITGTVTCCNAGAFSTIGGGLRNCATGYCSTVGGGAYNCASGSESTVGGGYDNCAFSSSTVSGGISNTASGNWSTVGGGYNNCASGHFSTVSGGRYNSVSGAGSTVGGGGGIFGGNTASGNYSTVSGGRSNTASGNCSTVSGGYYAKASKYGELSHAAGRFANTGDAQHSTLVARRNTTDATANQVLFLDGSSERLTIPAETTWMFEIKLAAHNDTNNDGAWWTFRGGIKRDAANGTSIIGSVIEENSKDTNMSTASASVVADDTNEALEIRVTGVAAKNIRWVAVVDISQVSWGTP